MRNWALDVLVVRISLLIYTMPLTSSLARQGSLSPPPSYCIFPTHSASSYHNGEALGEGKEFESFVRVHDHLSLFVLLSPSMIVTPDCNVCKLHNSDLPALRLRDTFHLQSVANTDNHQCTIILCCFLNGHTFHPFEHSVQSNLLSARAANGATNLRCLELPQINRHQSLGGYTPLFLFLRH